jgi:hypothetical protein
MNPSLCQQQRVSGGRCTNRSAFRYTWPGRDESTVCQGCSHKLRNVAAAIGLALELLPYEEPVSTPNLDEVSERLEHLNRAARDTLPAPPLDERNEAEGDPPWMRERKPYTAPTVRDATQAEAMRLLADSVGSDGVRACPSHGAMIWDVSKPGWVCLDCEAGQS